MRVRLRRHFPIKFYLSSTARLSENDLPRDVYKSRRFLYNVDMYSENQIQSMAALHRLCFGDSEAYTDLFFGKRFEPDRSAVRFDADVAVGAVYTRTLRVAAGNRTFSVPFFTGIATHPDYRYRRIAADLIEEVIVKLRAENAPFALLHPFSVPFYLKRRFSVVNRFRKLPFPDLAADPALSTKPLSPGDAPLLSEAYRNATSHAAIRIERSAEDFEVILEETLQEGGTGSLIFRNGIPCGYVLCNGEEIAETVVRRWEDLAALPGLRGKSILLPAANGAPYSMARLVDPIAFLAIAPVAPGVKDSFILGVGDRRVLLDCDGKRIAARSTDRAPDLTVSERDLLLAGLGSGRYVLQLPDRLRALFPTCNPLFYETY